MSKTQRSQYATEDKKLEKKIRKNQTKKKTGTKTQEVQKILEQEENDLIFEDEDDEFHQEARYQSLINVE